MNEKISLQDLCGKIADNAKTSKKNAEAFLRTLFTLIEEALKKDGVVKVPNLGTFKLTHIDERKSVNVRNGEEMIIPAYNRVSFTPDKDLKEKVNQPYAHLEAFYTVRKDGPVDPPETADEDLDETVDDSADIPTGIVSTQEEPSVNDVKDDNDTLINKAEDKKEESEAIAETPTADENPAEDIIEEKPEKDTEEVLNERAAEEEKTQTEVNITNPINNDMDEKLATNENEEKLDSNPTPEENTSKATPQIETTVSPDAEGKEAEVAEEKSKANDDDDNEASAKAPSEKKGNGKSKHKKSDETAQKGSKSWLVWLIIGVIFIIGVLFGVRYAKNNGLWIFGNMETQTETITEPEKSADETAATETESSDTEEIGEEETEHIDCFDTPEACPTGIETAEESAAAEAISNNEERFPFDPALVDFMKKNHPELNFPTSAPVLETYTVKEGSRLAQISRNVYSGAFHFWVYIYYFNTDILASPNDVKGGQKLRIPDLGADFVDPTSSKCKKIASEVQEKLLN